MRWYYRIGRKVWPYELWHFLFRDRRSKQGPSLEQFLGRPPNVPDPVVRIERVLKTVD
jgi:anaerobic magnesium-protoporphyrin IX monomethyl ester cyclase